MSNWKDGEVFYCLRLVRHGGDASVPRPSVAGYLELQYECAMRDCARDVPGAQLAADAMQNLVAIWDDVTA